MGAYYVVQEDTPVLLSYVAKLELAVQIFACDAERERRQ